MAAQSWLVFPSPLDGFNMDELVSQPEQYEKRLHEMRDEITTLRNHLQLAKSVIAWLDPSIPLDDLEAAAEQCQASVAANGSTKDNAVSGLPPDAGRETAHCALPPAPPPAALAAKEKPTAELLRAHAPAVSDPMLITPRPKVLTKNGPYIRARYLWKIVRGDGTDGIRVQEREAIDSPFLDGQLCIGTLVEEIKLCDDRLHFRLLAGVGPKEGWIFTKLQGKTMAMRVDRAPLKPRQLQLIGVGPDNESPLPIAFLFPEAPLTRSTYQALLRIELPGVKEKLDKAKQIAGFDIQMNKMPRVTSLQYYVAAFLVGAAGLENIKVLHPKVVRRAAAMTGLGTGLYMALVTAGVLPFEDALALVRLRFELFQEQMASRKQGVTAVTGLGLEALWPLCLKARKREGMAAVCEITVHLPNKIFWVSGTEMALGLLESLAMTSGAQVRRMALIASNCELSRPFQARYEAALDKALPSMEPPLHTVWMPSSAEPMRSGCNPADIVAELKAEFTSPILYAQSGAEMLRDGISQIHRVMLTPGPEAFAQWAS